jgi:hypothetical protein
VPSQCSHALASPLALFNDVDSLQHWIRIWMLWLLLTAHAPSVTPLLQPADMSQFSMSSSVAVQSSPRAGDPLCMEPAGAPYESHFQTARQAKERHGLVRSLSGAGMEREQPRPSPVVLVPTVSPWPVWSPQALAPLPADEPPLS